MLIFFYQDKAAVQGKCACVGGANFFGSNQNGKTFFKPNRVSS